MANTPREAIRFSIVEDQDVSEALRDAQGALDTIPIIERFTVEVSSSTNYPSGLVVATAGQRATQRAPSAVLMGKSVILDGGSPASAFPDSGDIRFNGMFWVDPYGSLVVSPPRGVTSPRVLEITFIAVTWP